jgi:hypothetical protein
MRLHPITLDHTILPLDPCSGKIFKFLTSNAAEVNIETNEMFVII